MLEAVQDGYDFPDTITEEDYRYIREHKDENPALTGFVGFGCSFGGKWFGGYARTSRKQDNYALATKRSLIKLRPKIQNVQFLCQDYRQVYVPEGSIVYCDPPYRNTTAYKGIEPFDTDAFWDYARILSETCDVFVSEQTAPPDIKVVWEKQVKRILNKERNVNPVVYERLYYLPSG